MGAFGGATTNTSGSNASTSTSTGTNASTTAVTPNIPQWYSTFLGSLPGQMQSLASTLRASSSHPLYGPQQQVNFQDTLAHKQAADQQTLDSHLASVGALNSGRSASMHTDLALGGQKQLADYLAQVPQLNHDAQFKDVSQLTQLLSQMAGFTAPISAFGSTQTGTSTAGNSVVNTGTNTGVGQTNPNLTGALLTGGIGAGLGALLQSLGLTEDQITKLIGSIGGGN